MSNIAIQNVSKKFGSIEVLKGIDLEIPDGSFTVLLGPSGCGKSTLLRIIAGLEKTDSGKVGIDDLDVTQLPPGERDVAMVFQNYALYPHLTVYQNIEYGLKARKIHKQERERLVQDSLDMVRLQDQAKKLPAQMSGGQRQRVALARAIVKRPKAFLMDEPLSNLDAKLRGTMRFELIELYHKLHTTFLYVTHDQVEAMSMGTNIIILDKGLVQQQGSPRDIYERPANTFVATFIGSPPASIFTLDKFTYCIRPEHISLHTIDSPYILVPGNILTSEHLGNETIYGVNSVLGPLSVRSINQWNSEQRRVSLYFPLHQIMVFDEEGLRVDFANDRLKALAILEKSISSTSENILAV